jgi:hypothetical protein
LASTSGIPHASSDIQQPQIATLGWALRRAALGLALLFVIVAVGAWLLWAGIDPDEAAAADGAGPSQVVTGSHR